MNGFVNNFFQGFEFLQLEVLFFSEGRYQVEVGVVEVSLYHTAQKVFGVFLFADNGSQKIQFTDKYFRRDIGADL